MGKVCLWKVLRVGMMVEMKYNIKKVKKIMNENFHVKLKVVI